MSEPRALSHVLPGGRSRGVVPAHRVAEFSFAVGDPTAGGPRVVDALIRSETGKGEARRHPMFWRGGAVWSLRFSSPVAGRWTFEVEADGERPTGAGGEIAVGPPADDNPLLARGPITLDPGRTHFVHADGTPFFWLADSWWFGMCSRLRWPGEFLDLLADRAAKGFSVIQFAIGFPCDIRPYDPRGANEAGDPWTADYGRLNPAYFDHCDRRIDAMVAHGLVPNIVGMWGYYLPFMGVEKARAHWRYLVARYGAYPVTWTLCGESRLTMYGPKPPEEAERQQREQFEGWADVGRMVRAIDPYGRLRTVHIGPPPGGRDEPPLADTSVLDFNFLQPGHSDHDAMFKVVGQLERERARSDKPTLVGEVMFEGMFGGAGPKAQRNVFWAAVLNGAPGHCYGVDAMWQMNRPGEPFGKSPGGYVWGNHPFTEAMHWAGSAHLGVGRRILETMPWWRLRPMPDAVSKRPAFPNPDGAYAAGIPGELRLLYIPSKAPAWYTALSVRGLEPGSVYRRTFIDPITGNRHPMPEPMRADDPESLKVRGAPILQDWLLLLERQP